MQTSPSPRPLIPRIMPTYEYSCQKCGQRKVKRLLGTGAGLIFKGSGFYVTDYRSDSYKEAAKKEAPSTSTAAEKSTAPKEAGGKAVAETSTKTPEKKSPKEPS